MDAEWTLTNEQSIFFMQHQVEMLYFLRCYEQIKVIAASDEYKSLFGDMPFDEAYDRFESMREEC